MVRHCHEALGIGRQRAQAASVPSRSPAPRCTGRRRDLRLVGLELVVTPSRCRRSSAGFFSSISTSGRPLTNRMMSGRRVRGAPLMENWLTAPELVARCIRPVEQAHEVAAVSPSCWYCTGTPPTSSLWNCPVGRQQRRDAEVEHAAQCILAGRGGHLRVQARDRIAQAAGQHHLAVVGALRVGAVVCDVRSRYGPRSPARTASPGFLFELVFGHHVATSLCSRHRLDG